MPQPEPQPKTPEIVGLVLAGGRSRRFGTEKAAALFEGRPLLDRGLEVLASSCPRRAINAPAGTGAAALAAERSLDLVCDAPGDPDGPLSGVLAGLIWARGLGATWLATIPCDTPRLPADLVPRLIAAAGDGPGASAESSDGRQPLCALWRVELVPSLSATLREGHPAVWSFQDAMGMARVRFSDSGAFANINAPDRLELYRRTWSLTPDGPSVLTRSSWLQPVQAASGPAMLKLPLVEEERRAMAVLRWFSGGGAVPVLRIDEGTILMQRLANDQSLTAMAEATPEGDEAACRIICGVVGRLHDEQPAAPPSEAVPLPVWFDALQSAAGQTPLLSRAWSVAQGLLAGNREPRVLHGDIHHENILHDPKRGWMAVDPKGLIGPRGYDYANLLRNPLTATARDPDRLRRLAVIVSQTADLPMSEVVGWALAHAGLSAVWSRNAGQDPGHALAVASLSATLLDSGL